MGLLVWWYCFFALFLFNPLLKAVGPQQTTIIICVGLVGIAVVKVVECLTEDKRCRCCEQAEEAVEEATDDDEDF